MTKTMSSMGVSTLTVGRSTKPSHSGAVYKLTQKLGEGRNGVVFKGYNTGDTSDGFDPADTEPVAIKFLKCNQGGVAAQMLRREVALQAILKSPYLANVEDYLADPEQPYLVMEYVPETLFGLFRKKAINQKVIMNLIRQTPLLLKDFLNAGIVHLDLKPNNVGYQGGVIGEEVDLEDYDNGGIIALDYGLALLLPLNGGSIVRHTGTAQTLPYSAPEFVQNGEVNRTTDTYGIGRTLEWVLTGVLSESPAEFRENVISYHGEKPPQSLIEMYAAMTAPDMSGRPSPEELERIATPVVAELEERTILFSAKSIQKSPAPADERTYARADWSSVDEPTSSELRALEMISEKTSRVI